MTDNKDKSTSIIRNHHFSTSKGDSTIVIRDEIISKSSFHSNVAQEFVTTTIDKIKLSLLEHKFAIKAQNDWKAPLGIILTIIPSIVAADFKQFLGLTPDTWKAMFVIGGIICLAWLIFSVWLTPDTWKAMFVIGGIICLAWLIFSVWLALKNSQKSEIDYLIESIVMPIDDNSVKSSNNENAEPSV